MKPIDRSQSLLRAVVVERLVGPGHPVRAIWELTAQWDRTAYYEPIQAVQGVAGRSATDPRLLTAESLIAVR